MVVSNPLSPAPLPGTEMIGEYQDSGFREPHFLVRRPDGQIVQLTRLLYLVLAELDGVRDYADVAARVGERSGRPVDPELLERLVEARLRPAGLLDGPAPDPDVDTPAPAMRPDPLLFLRFRVALVPERVVWILAGLFRGMFRRPVVALALAGFVAMDVALVATGTLAEVVPALTALVGAPELILAVLGVVLVAGVFHECGHVAACRYGGARPGVMGVGLYLVWPAMYSTVTESYRLDRRGRLRVDLAGVYFNAVAMAVLGGVYLLTGSPWVLIALILLHIDTLWQFLPSIRLDGYYILSDLVGVPDLFSRLGPILRSAVPGRPPHPRVAELKPWTRRVVTIWVVVVIPSLIYLLVAFLSTAPHVLPALGDTWLRLGGEVSEGLRTGALASSTLSVIQMILLVLPWVGVSLILGHFAGLALRRAEPTLRERIIVVGAVVAGVGIVARIATRADATTARPVLGVAVTAVVVAGLLVLGVRRRIPAVVAAIPLLIVALVGPITDAVAVLRPTTVGLAALAVVTVALTEVPVARRRQWYVLLPVGVLLAGALAVAPGLVLAVAVVVAVVLMRAAYRHCRPIPWSLVLGAVAAAPLVLAGRGMVEATIAGFMEVLAGPVDPGPPAAVAALLTAATAAALLLVAFRNRPSPARHARPARTVPGASLALPRGAT